VTITKQKDFLKMVSLIENLDEPEHIKLQKNSIFSIEAISVFHLKGCWQNKMSIFTQTNQIQQYL